MKQRVLFDNKQVLLTPGIHNQLYAWSKKHNIVFVETHYTDGLAVNFGRESDLTVFLLTWPQSNPQPRVV